MEQDDVKSTRFAAFRNLKDRQDLTGEHRSGDAGQIILLILFLAVWIADSFFFHFSTFLAPRISLYVRIPAALLLLVFWICLSRAGIGIVFGTIRKTPRVIDTGAFSIVRHPIYLGSILFYAGLFTLTLSLLSGGMIPLITVYYQFLARYEENLLIARFGDAYRDYMKKVPMWIPRVGRKRSP